MPSLVVHVSVSLALSIITKAQLPEAMMLAITSILPDVDIIAERHRSPTHSISFIPLVWMLGSMAVIAGFSLNLPFYCCVSHILHILMDALSSPTPLLWPIYNPYIRIHVKGFLISARSPSLDLSVKISKEAPPKRGGAGGPLFYGPDLVILIVFLIAYLSLPI